MPTFAPIRPNAILPSRPTGAFLSACSQGREVAGMSEDHNLNSRYAGASPKAWFSASENYSRLEMCSKVNALPLKLPPF